MSDESFKLCREAGLRVYHHQGEGRMGYIKSFDYVDASEVEQMLSLAPVVYGSILSADKGGPWVGQCMPPYDTHTARLVNVQPIVRDTAEGLLRELVNDKRFERYTLPSDFVERARRLLEGK